MIDIDLGSGFAAFVFFIFFLASITLLIILSLGYGFSKKRKSLNLFGLLGVISLLSLFFFGVDTFSTKEIGSLIGSPGGIITILVNLINLSLTIFSFIGKDKDNEQVFETDKNLL